MDLIYLDNNATTKVSEEVFEATRICFLEIYGNANSQTHAFGFAAKKLVETARKNIKKQLGVSAGQLLFTSGATESINLGIKSLFSKNGQILNGHIITTQTEHKAVLDVCEFLASAGVRITYLSVNRKGLINLKELENSICEDTRLISVMFANNETGVIQDIPKIAELAKQKDILMMSDCTQAIGKIPFNMDDLGLDMMAFSGHKIHAPKGVGGLYLSPKAKKQMNDPIIHGGGHEFELRSGTLNVPGIVALATAVEMATNNFATSNAQIQTLRDQLEAALMELGGVTVNGFHANRTPNVVNITIEGVHNKTLIKLAKFVAFSLGSACTSANPQPSHVLKAMDLTEEEANNTIRLSLSKYTTEAEINNAIKILGQAIQTVRKIKNNQTRK